RGRISRRAARGLRTAAQALQQPADGLEDITDLPDQLADVAEPVGLAAGRRGLPGGASALGCGGAVGVGRLEVAAASEVLHQRVLDAGRVVAGRGLDVAVDVGLGDRAASTTN